MKKQYLILAFTILLLFSLKFIPGVSAQIDPGLIAHWDFSQVNNNIVIDKIGGYSGENEGGVLTNDGYSGSGMIFDFDRDASMIYGGGVITTPLPAMNKFTVSYRIKLIDLPQNAIEDRALPHGSSFGSSLRGNILTYGLSTNFASGANIDISNLSKNTWHYFAFVWDRSTLKFYENGVLVKSTPAGTLGPASDNWGFGGVSTSPQPTHTVSDIQLDEIKIYNIDLTSSQILEENNSNTLSCTSDIWNCGDWTACSSNGQQTRTCTQTFNCPIVSTPPVASQSCTPSCTLDFWDCGEWSACSQSGQQTRSCNKTLNCEGGDSLPVTTRSCTYVPPCTSADWSCTNWSVCSQNNSQTRTCSKASNCQGGVSSPATSQSCTYVPTCISFYYSNWSECGPDGKQTRSITSRYPSNCEGEESPKTTQSCTYISPCNADTWTCGAWGSCSPSGIQNRSCTKTFDCLSVETAPPSISEYCTPPNLEKYQVSPADQQVVNQDNIIKATVNLWCPLNEKWYSVGSGTIIDSSGTILTNKHVVAYTGGCLVGFVDSYKDEPYFGNRHIADIIKISTNADVAILKLRNPYKRVLTYIDVTRGNSDVLRLGDKISTYGYPTGFGSKITSTRGEFSGVEGDFLKTTAIIDKGNSGGGAYLQDGSFIGIPTKVFPATFNVLGGILSVNKVKNWLYNAPMAYNDESYNKYSRVSSVLENIDLKKLDTLKLFISDTDEKGNNLVAPPIDQNSQNAKEQPQTSQAQEESIVLGPTGQPEEEIEELPKENQQQGTTQVSEQKPKRKIFMFLANALTVIKDFFTNFFSFLRGGREVQITP